MMINNYQISVIIPCYNEISTIEKIVEKVKKNIQDQDEIIIVDDFSSDGSREFLEKYKLEKNITVYFNEMNMGKGYSIRRGIDKSKGNIIIIQDADLEYDPADYQKLLLPFLETDADIVYGSRFIGGSKYVRTHFFWHYIANKILTFMCNLVSNLNLTDMETGYKVFKSSCVKQLSLKENTFGIEPELTIKFDKKKFKFFEVPISYNGRSYHEGKKITLKDAFIAVYCIVKYSFKD